jgi:hypothetical protein
VLSANTYDDLVPILVQRRKDLGLSQAQLDHIAGWTDGYTSKLELGQAKVKPTSKFPDDEEKSTARVAGKLMLPIWLQALGVTLAVVVPTSNQPKERA